MANLKKLGEQVRKAIEQNSALLKQDIYGSAPFDKHKRGIITAIPTNNEGYTVKIDNVEYTKVPKINGLTLSLRDVVECIIPNNQMSQIFIIGKLTYSA